MNWLGLLAPVVYLGVLLGSLATFSNLYRKRKATASQRLQPYFGPHTARNVYLTLLHMSDDQNEKSQVPKTLLTAALQERAIEDIMRVREIQMRKGPLNTLLQRGVVGDEIWQRLLRAEKELEEELKDLVAEANGLQEGWGNSILQTANEITVRRITMKNVAEKRATLEKERADWEAKRESSRRELEGEPTPQSVPDPAGNVSSTSPETPEKAKTNVSSDEDGVIVESPEDRDTHPSLADVDIGASTASVNGGGKKKRKNKKG